MSDHRRPRVDHPRGRPRSVTSGRPSSSGANLPSPPPFEDVRERVEEFVFEEVPRDVDRPTFRSPMSSAATPPRVPTAPVRSSALGDSGAGRNGRRESSRRSLKRALATPGAARQAFLLREVLGPPVALRADEGDRPS